MSHFRTFLSAFAVLASVAVIFFVSGRYFQGEAHPCNGDSVASMQNRIDILEGRLTNERLDVARWREANADLHDALDAARRQIAALKAQRRYLEPFMKSGQLVIESRAK